MLWRLGFVFRKYFDGHICHWWAIFLAHSMRLSAFITAASRSANSIQIRLSLLLNALPSLCRRSTPPHCPFSGHRITNNKVTESALSVAYSRLYIFYIIRFLIAYFANESAETWVFAIIFQLYYARTYSFKQFPYRRMQITCSLHSITITNYHEQHFRKLPHYLSARFILSLLYCSYAEASLTMVWLYFLIWFLKFHWLLGSFNTVIHT